METKLSLIVCRDTVTEVFNMEVEEYHTYAVGIFRVLMASPFPDVDGVYLTRRQEIIDLLREYGATR